MNSKKKIERTTLREHRTNDGEVSLLEAYLNEDGDLVLEGYDVGKSVERFWGDSDYEYWRVVKSVHVPRVLMGLIADRFESDTEFHNWLKEKGIPDEFGSWI